MDKSQGRRPWYLAERNMSGAVMRGTIALPGSKNTSRAKGLRWKLGDPASDHGQVLPWSASGKRGAVADDARAREKTRLIEFGRHAAARRAQRGGVGKPDTFNFLGFRFICGKSRRGKFLLTRKTRRDRLRAKLKEIKEELRKRMHQPVPEQGAWLKQVVVGFYNYHAVPTNGHALWSFRDEVTRRWQQTRSSCTVLV
jgi:hypothetical protein